MSLRDYYDLFYRRWRGVHDVNIPKAVEDSFANPQNDGEREIKALIDAYAVDQATKFEQLLFAQKTRLTEAERKLETKVTKAAQESQRIATKKIDWALDKLADLKRTEPRPIDSRIFPGWFAPVMIVENGQRVIKPMRYQCRPAGRPAFYDTKYPGTFNARRDNLEGFWKGTFGVSHGVIISTAFFEHVMRHKAEGRQLAEGEAEEDVVIKFTPQNGQDMLAACLWSHCKDPGDETGFYSFAAITDEPPAEVLAAGHDRCIVPIREENLDRWLNPDPADLASQYAVLDDRERPYYEHRMAA